MSLTCCIKSHCTLAPAHTPCLFSIDLHTVWQHLVIVHFLLLLLLSGTLFQMMSGVPHHCHHLSLVWRHTCFVQFTKTEQYPWTLYKLWFYKFWFYSHIVRSSAGINYFTAQHTTFFCLYRPPPNRRNNLTDSMFTEQLPDLLDYVNSLPGFVGDMNIHFDNPLQSLTKQKLSTLSLYSLVQVINKPTHRCGGGGGGVDPIPCVSTHRISDPRSGPAQLLPPHVKQRSHPHGVRPQIPDR